MGRADGKRPGRPRRPPALALLSGRSHHRGVTGRHGRAARTLAAGTAPSHWRDRRARGVPRGVESTSKVEADVCKHKGIGSKHTEMLGGIGVATIKELLHRDPAHLLEMIEMRPGPVVGTSVKNVTDWIEHRRPEGVAAQEGEARAGVLARD